MVNGKTRYNTRLMMRIETIGATQRHINNITGAIPWWDLEDDNVPLAIRYFMHGKRDAALYHLALWRHPEVIPPGVFLSDMDVAAALHDVGKPFITEGDPTLWDRGVLSDDDRRKIRNHPLASYDQLIGVSQRLGINIPGVAFTIALTHHERLNGSGYPRRLRADQIPLYVQLFSVVDYVISMREGPDIRPYREKGHSPADIQTYLTELGARDILNALFIGQVFDLLKRNEHMQIQELAFLGDWSGLQSG